MTMNSLHDQALTKATRKLLPFLFFLYVLAYLDRINVSFAQLQMEKELGFSDAVYGFGASIFFVGYTLFEIPSNLMLRRVGARWWIARIMLTWGLISSGMAFIQTPTEFYVTRFALGIAEAGFFPGIILYLSDWFPEARRAKVVSIFMTATAMAGVIGAPLSGFLLQFHGLGGLHGWQWLFLIEGIPSVVAGLAVFFLLPDAPNQAQWLTVLERESITAALAKEKTSDAGVMSFGQMLVSIQIWRLGFLYLSIIFAFNSLSLWLPQIIKSVVQLDTVSTAFLSALPFLVAVLAMLFNGYHSDRTGERRWHVILPACLGAFGLLLTVVMNGHPDLQMLGLCLTTAGVWSTLGPFWALPASLLAGRSAAVGIALINSVGALGGFLGPNFMALCKTHLGNFDLAMTGLAIFLLLGGLQLSWK